MNKDMLKVLTGLFPGSTSASDVTPVEVIPTRLPSMNNIVLGCGGLPRGRTIELYAAPSIGKTTLSLNWIVDALALNLNCTFLDREGSFPDARYTDPMGLKREDLFMMETADGTDALFKVRQAIAMDVFDLMVIDSIPALQPRSRAEIDSGTSSMHDNFARAKLLTDFFNDVRGGYMIRTTPPKGSSEKAELIESEKEYCVEGKWTKHFHKLSDKKMCLVLINHMKNDPGKMFGDKAKTAGGDSGKFDATIRLRIKKVQQSKAKDKFGTPLYRVVEIQADKNKVAPPNRSAQFALSKDGVFHELSEIGAVDFEAANEADEELEAPKKISFKKK